MNKSDEGITLIALVVTIIVLLILAGVTIAMILGQDGIFRKAELAKEKTNYNSIQERINLTVTETVLEKNGKAYLSKIRDKLVKYNRVYSRVRLGYSCIYF